MKILISLALLLIGSVSYASEDSILNPFDTSKTDKQIEELGIPTVQEVASLEKSATSLLSNCRAAIPVLEEYSKKANWLANLIAGGIEPYYGASYDKRKDYPYAKVSKLVPIEAAANEYRRKRNQAMVMHGECLIATGEQSDGVSLLIKALDLIAIDNEEWWNRARSSLYKEIGFGG